MKDIKKYIKNKDIEITNDDFDIEKLESDLRKGYVLEDEVDSRVKSALDGASKSSKVEYDKLKSQFDELQNSYTDIEKRNTDLAERNKSLTLENVMTREGFKEEDFKDVSAMRYSIFKDEVDDVKAIQGIKEKFNGTYFPTPVEEKKIKNDLPINNGVEQPVKPKANRLTSIKDLILK